MKFDVSDAAFTQINAKADTYGISREGWVRRVIQRHLDGLPERPVMNPVPKPANANIVECRVNQHDRERIAAAVAAADITKVAWLRAVVCAAAA